MPGNAKKPKGKAKASKGAAKDERSKIDELVAIQKRLGDRWAQYLTQLGQRLRQDDIKVSDLGTDYLSFLNGVFEEGGNALKVVLDSK